MIARRVERAAPWVAGALLLIVYLLSMAPDITFWDAGEFIAAAHSLGIPHPPGTPLYVLLLAVWTKLFFFLPFQLATNLFSAVSTALAAVLTAHLVQRGSGDGWWALAAALCAGGMSSVWLNATETEVYAASLGLALLTLWTAERAGRLRSWRWRALVAYLLALAVPLHLSALLVAPAAIYLAADEEESYSVTTTVALAGALVMIAAFGTARVTLGVLGLSVLVVGTPIAALLQRRAGRDDERRESAARVGARALGGSLGVVLCIAVAVSAVAFMLVRARHDPAINQGNPDNLHTLLYVISRKQYEVAPIWPRQAPWWLQVGNLFEYVDWQVALSLAPSVVPSVPRVLMTVVFVALGLYGSLAHRGADRRTWRAIALLTFFGSVGAAAYLNLKASPSFGYGILPDNAVREARERDYFFVLGFWGWGVWAGVGAVSLVRRFQGAQWIGVLVAALPIAFNWLAVERRSAPESELPRVFAEETLRSAPRDAVLFVAGDNDTYPLWALQQLENQRRDVSIVTLPLLAAGWSQKEIARRYQLLDSRQPTMSTMDAASRIAGAAFAKGRPVAAAMMVTPGERRRLGGHWALHGMVYVAESPALAVGEGEAGGEGGDVAASWWRVDSVATQESRDRIQRWRRGREVRESTDPIQRYMLDLLACPASLLAAEPSDEQKRSLDSTCNRR